MGLDLSLKGPDGLLHILLKHLEGQFVELLGPTLGPGLRHSSLLGLGAEIILALLDVRL